MKPSENTEACSMEDKFDLWLEKWRSTHASKWPVGYEGWLEVYQAGMQSTIDTLRIEKRDA